MKENDFTHKKWLEKMICTKIITYADYPDDLVLLVNKPAQVESFLHSWEQAARGISLYMNSDKTEFICFN